MKAKHRVLNFLIIKDEIFIQQQSGKLPHLTKLTAPYLGAVKLLNGKIYHLYQETSNTEFTSIIELKNQDLARVLTTFVNLSA